MKDNKDRDEVLAEVKEDGGVENKLKNQLLEQKIIKISIYLRDIGEIETMTATYFFEDGTEKKGNSYNNNSLDGDIYFSDVEDLVLGEGPFPMKDFMASFMENNWTQFIQESVDNFSGGGDSIDYDFDEFEDYEELDCVDCEWDADDLEPNSITLFFDKSELTLDSDSDAGTYKNNEITFTKKELLTLIKKNQDTTIDGQKLTDAHNFNEESDMESLDKMFRILICRSEEIEVNMVYAEVGGDDYEIFGAFSGASGGGGLFHSNTDLEVTVGDDAGEFRSNLTAEENYELCSQLERLRAEFEEYNDEGDLVGLSEKGLEFLRTGNEDDDGYSEVYSEGASEDFIYDVQDHWNLHFYKG